MCNVWEYCLDCNDLSCENVSCAPHNISINFIENKSFEYFSE